MPFVILSMTSIPSRMHRLLPIITQLLQHQIFVFDRLLLFIPQYCVRQKSCYIIPDELTALQSDRFEIRRCDMDDGPATKIIPAMRAFCCHSRPCVVISVDDDVFLESHAIEELVKAHRRESTAILGFMGVVAPHFFHGDVIAQQTLNVMLLGGYRAILYPQCVFRSFVAIFDSFRKQSSVSGNMMWPYPVMDDDYLFARTAHSLRLDCKVIRSDFRHCDHKLNIQFDHNLDGVSGKQGSENHINASRVMTDAFFAAREQTSHAPKMMHIICRSSKQQSNVQQHIYINNTKFATHDKFQDHIDMQTLVAYLMRLFHPTVRDTPLHTKRVDYVLVTHCVLSVDINRIVDMVKGHFECNMTMMLPRMESIGTQETIGPFMLLLTRNDVFKLIADPHYEPCFPSRFTEIIIRDWNRLCYINLARVVCFVDQPNMTTFDLLWNRRWKQVAQIWYCANDITTHVYQICDANKPHEWHSDGTNAQMDAMFGDPSPGVVKCVTVQLHDGQTITQNTDWMFCIKDQHLMVR